MSLRVHGSASNGLFVGLEKLQKLEADTHPLPGAHVLGASIGDAAHEVDAVLLHFFVPVLQNGRQPWEQILDGRIHAVHSNHIDNAFQGAQDGPQDLGILLAQVLVQNDT